MTTRTLIGYVRVSTSQQGRSGLGIESQREALARFAASEGFELARVFVEVETGKGSDALDRRPQLAAALSEARRQTLLRSSRQARQAQPRRSLYLGADGPPRSVPCR
jgi:DNA invertase Pin-like site-specific DNA recombinase